MRRFRCSRCADFDVHDGPISADSLTDNQIRPKLRLVNRSGVGIALNRITLRYWFTADVSGAGFMSGCYSAMPTSNGPNDSSKMTVSAERISPAFSTADSVMSASFAFTDVLGPGESTGYFLPYVNLTNWANFNETNDWSQTLSATPVTAPKIAVYVDGQLWWGEEPK